MNNLNSGGDTSSGKFAFELVWIPIVFVVAVGILVWQWYQKSNPDDPGLSFEHVYEPEAMSGLTENITRLRADRRGHYVFAGSINGKPVKFLLDTGATTVAIPMHLRDYLGLIQGSEYYVITANGKAIAYDSLIRHIQVGSIELNNIRGSINPGMKEDEILLGMSFLKDLEILQKSGEITLVQRKESNSEE